MRFAALGAAVVVATACQRQQASNSADSASAQSPTRGAAPDTAPAQSRGAARDTTSRRGLDVSELVVTLSPVESGNTPADLLVTSPSGQRSGVDPHGFAALAEIPSASYDSSPPPTQTDTEPEPASLPRQFDLVTPAPGTYTIAVVGRRRGPYELSVRLTTSTGVVRTAVARGIVGRAGEVRAFALTYAPSDTGPVALKPVPSAF